MKKRKKIILVIILILITIIAIYIISNKDNNVEQDEQIDREEMLEEYFEGKIFPENLYVVRMAYTGTVSFSSFYERIYYMVNDLPNLNKINAKEYYLKKRTNIQYYYGISDAEKFEDFISYIKEKNINTTEYQQIKFDENHVIVKNDGIETKLVIQYSENKVCTFTMLFSNRNVNPVLRIKDFE